MRMTVRSRYRCVLPEVYSSLNCHCTYDADGIVSNLWWIKQQFFMSIYPEFWTSHCWRTANTWLVIGCLWLLLHNMPRDNETIRRLIFVQNQIGISFDLSDFLLFFPRPSWTLPCLLWIWANQLLPGDRSVLSRRRSGCPWQRSEDSVRFGIWRSVAVLDCLLPGQTPSA